MPYRLVHHDNGTTSVGCTESGEVMHPTVGPEIEARNLYVDGLGLATRQPQASAFVVWDVGMGAAANAVAALDALRDHPSPTTIISFDHTAEALRFALVNMDSFPLLARHQTSVAEILKHGRTRAGSVSWSFIKTDFPDWLAVESPAPSPHAVFFDAWSPKSNPAMWTLNVFQRLRARMADRAALATYSRATCIRAALLLAGYFVGRGPAIGAKEETTIAATSLDQLADPLPSSWLGKAERSHSGRPLLRNEFEQAPLAPEQLRQLRAHPQFR